MLYALLTHNFNILCFEQNKIIQRKIDNINDISEIAFVGKIADFYSITNHQQNSWFDFDTMTMNRAIPNGHLTLANIEDGLYSFTHNTYYMRSNEVNSIDFIASTIGDWEQFRLLTLEQLQALLHLVRNKWHVVGEQAATYVNLKQSTFKEIVFNNLSLDFNQIINAITTSSTDKSNYCLNFIFYVDWVPYKAVLIKPAIVFVLFGRGAAFSELEVSLESLYDIGKYDGDTYFITDLTKQDLISLVPKHLTEKVHIIPMIGKDRLDFVGARIGILCSDLLDKHQPILYSDADIVYDCDINNFIHLAANAKYCSAQIENATHLKSTYSTGSDLFAQNPFNIENVHGFNAGILLIPNMQNHKQNIKAAYATITTYTTQYGRESVRFYDQSILNYVLYKLQDFNPSPISERTQVGPVKTENNPDTENNSDTDNNLVLGLDILKPKGFVHFWDTIVKAQDMKTYVDALKKTLK